MLFGTLVPWASAFAAIRAALKSFEPGPLALIRFLFTSTMLGWVAVVRRPRRLSRRDAPTWL